MTYGNPYFADALHNINIGGPFENRVAFPFTLGKATKIDSLLYYNCYSKEKPGYNDGTGGKIKISLVQGELDKHKTLTKTVLTNPTKEVGFLKVKFDKEVILGGGGYCVLFENIDPNPKVNYVSVNTTYCAMSQFYRSPLSESRTYWSSGGDKWDLFKPASDCLPIFNLFHKNEVVYVGNSTIESWLREPRAISGDCMVRQVFTPKEDVSFERMFFRIASNNSTRPDHLYVRIIADKKLLTHAMVDGDDVSTVDNEVIEGFRLGHNVQQVAFSRPNVLEASVKHYVEFIAPYSQSKWYEMFPLRCGAQFGFAPVWENAWAEYTDTGPYNWRGWDAWGNANLKLSNLQLYFE